MQPHQIRHLKFYFEHHDFRSTLRVSERERYEERNIEIEKVGKLTISKSIANQINLLNINHPK